MKILIIQENGRHLENRHFRECYCLKRGFDSLGVESTVWGLGHENYQSNIDFNDFDLIINLENYGNGWEPNLESIKVKKFLWSIDAHFRGEEPFLQEFTKNKYDLLLHSTKDFVNSTHKVWFPNAFDDTLIYPKKIDKKCDVGFCGNVLNRKHYIDLLKNNFNFIFDNFVIGDNMVNAINSYKLHWNKNISIDLNYRNFETIGCGVPLITNYNHQYDELGFVHLVNVIFYKKDKELLENINLVLKNEDLLESIGKKGYELSKEHTYKKRCEQIIKLYNQL